VLYYNICYWQQACVATVSYNGTAALWEIYANKTTICWEPSQQKLGSSPLSPSHELLLSLNLLQPPRLTVCARVHARVLYPVAGSEEKKECGNHMSFTPTRLGHNRRPLFIDTPGIIDIHGIYIDNISRAVRSLSYNQSRSTISTVLSRRFFSSGDIFV